MLIKEEKGRNKKREGRRRKKGRRAGRIMRT